MAKSYSEVRTTTARRLAGLRHRPFSIPADPADAGRSYQLAVCAVFRNDADDLREWIEFHRLVGVEKFILFDNNSVDNFESVLSPYVASGMVSLHRLPRIRANFQFYRTVQLHAYNACLEQYRERARRIAFLDIDEFLNPQVVDSVVTFLAEYEAHPAVAVHWVMFATSGHILRPDGLATAAYTACAIKGNHRVKVIVDPRRTLEFLSPHHARYTGGAFAVNELGEPVPGNAAEPPTVSRIRINHYFTRSVEDFLRKYVRNEGYKSGHKNLRELTHAEREYASEVDTSIQRFLPRLRAALENG